MIFGFPKNEQFYVVVQDYEYKAYKNNIGVIRDILGLKWNDPLDFNALPLKTDSDGEPYYPVIINKGTILQFKNNASTYFASFKKYNRDNAFCVAINFYGRALNGIELEETKV